VEPALKLKVIGNGRYLKMSISTITEDDFEDEQWQVVAEEDDPAELELPETALKESTR
jgi:hypothetical protein